MYMQNRRVHMGVIANFTTSKTCDYCLQIASVVNNYGDHFCELKNKRIVQNDREVVDTLCLVYSRWSHFSHRNASPNSNSQTRTSTNTFYLLQLMLFFTIMPSSFTCRTNMNDSTTKAFYITDTLN